MELKTEQEFAIIAEVETGIFLLVEGLIAWDQLSGANDLRQSRSATFPPISPRACKNNVIEASAKRMRPFISSANR